MLLTLKKFSMIYSVCVCTNSSINVSENSMRLQRIPNGRHNNKSRLYRSRWPAGNFGLSKLHLPTAYQIWSQKLIPIPLPGSQPITRLPTCFQLYFPFPIGLLLFQSYLPFFPPLFLTLCSFPKQSCSNPCLPLPTSKFPLATITCVALLICF